MFSSGKCGGWTKRELQGCPFETNQPFVTSSLWTDHSIIRNDNMLCGQKHMPLMNPLARWAFVPQDSQSRSLVYDPTYASERWLLPIPDLFPRPPSWCNTLLRQDDDIPVQSGMVFGRWERYSGLT